VTVKEFSELILISFSFPVILLYLPRIDLVIQLLLIVVSVQYLVFSNIVVFLDSYFLSLCDLITTDRS
jgi:hypothetical protein